LPTPALLVSRVLPAVSNCLKSARQTNTTKLMDWVAVFAGWPHKRHRDAVAPLGRHWNQVDKRVAHQGPVLPLSAAGAAAERSAFLALAWRQWRILREWVERRLRFLFARRDAYLVPDRMVTISPARVCGIARGDFARGHHLIPPTISGDWDVTARPTDDGFHDDLRAVVAGSDWTTTRVYAEATACFRRG
jgi:hypothetical protein